MGSDEAESSSEVTRLLEAWGAGRTEALETLMERLQLELRRVAANHLRRERPGHTLQPTALVNELYIKLVGQSRATFGNREQFFALASRIMRRILIDHARERQAAKRKGLHVTLHDDAAESPEESVDLLALDLALEKLERLHPRECRVVELRYFAGLTTEEIARVLEVSDRTVKRDWRFAKRWIHTEMSSPRGRDGD